MQEHGSERTAPQEARQNGGRTAKPWEDGPLAVSGNGRYLCNGSRPFFWLADTAWLLFQQCSREEAYTYLRNRRDKGFNVIQAVLIHSMPEGGDSSLAAVEKDVTKPGYWEHCDRVVRMAEELGLYMALLPAWGSLVKTGVLNPDNIEEYVSFLAERYGKSPNVIWLLGGDIRGDGNEELYRREGTELKRLMPDKLVGYHPFGRTSSALWFGSEPWLDFNMFQSGHRRYDQASLGAWDDNAVREDFFGEDNWRYVDRDRRISPGKPTVDGEPSYEWILQGLHTLGEPYWREWDVRRYAYWSVFQGAMGHTYGDNAIQQFYRDKSKPGAYGVRQTWQESLQHVGSSHMGHLRRLMESVDYQSGQPAEELLLSGQKEKYERISVFAGPGFLLAYDYLGGAFTLDLTGFAGKQVHAWWFDPVSGAYSYLAELTGKEKEDFCPVARFTEDNDWVLVVREGDCADGDI